MPVFSHPGLLVEPDVDELPPLRASLVERALNIGALDLALVHPHEISGSANDTTHNRMELTAICEALESLTGAIEVRTDSTYVEKCFNQKWHERWLRVGWKGIKNRDLWERLFALVWDDTRIVRFVWIKGHAGDASNNRVDRLAQEAALRGGRKEQS